MQRIKRGDTVLVIAGKDKGERGEVLHVYPRQNRVIVSQVNVGRKAQRAVQAGRQQITPGLIEFEAPLDLSNVQLICPNCREAVRVGFRYDDEGTKVRFCRQCDQDID